MSFPSYPSYKESNLDWLPRIPDSWKQSRLKNLFDLMKRIPEETDEIVTAFRDGEVTLRSNRRIDGFTNAIHEHGYQRVMPNDLVIHAMDAFAGAIGVSDSVGKSTPVYSVCSLRDSHNNVHYFARLLRTLALNGFVNSLAKGVRERSTEFRWKEAGGIFVPLPSPTEQQAIASFLDHETAKIDALIAEQQRLIELLKEKRQAVISRAVTKGLNPHVRMKDSGVEWLGEVPEHWEVMPIRFAAKLESGHTPSRSRPDWWQDCKHPWISLGDVWQIRESKAKYIYETKEKISDLGLENSAARLLPKGTVVLSRTASVGFSGIMGSQMATTQDFANWVCRDVLLPEYLLFVFRSMGNEFARLKYGSTHNTIYMPDIMGLRFALPRIEEQVKILEFIDCQLNGHDALLASAKRSIELLNERRTALISAAVTGQIDVRGFKPVAA